MASKPASRTSPALYSQSFIISAISSMVRAWHLTLGSQTQVFSEAEMGSLPWISLALRPVPQESCMTALQP